MVQGAAPADLLAAMSARGPVVRGERAVAATRARISLGPSPSCGPYVHVHALLTLPVWHGARRATPQLRAWWSEVSTTIADHEREHLEIWLSAADELHRRLAAAPCADGERLVAQWLGEVDARHRAFDAREQLGAWPAYPSADSPSE